MLFEVKTACGKVLVSWSHCGRCSGDGARAGHHMLCMSKVQGCPDPAAFQRACVQLFKTEGNIHGPAGIDLDKVCPGSPL